MNKMQIALCVAVLLLALHAIPGVEALQRFASWGLAAIFGLAAYRGFHRHLGLVAYPFLILTLIYQPFVPVTAAHVAWWVLSGVVAVLLIGLCLLPIRLLPHEHQRRLTVVRHVLFGIN